VILFILYSIISSSILVGSRYSKYDWMEGLAVAIAWPLLPAIIVFSVPLAIIAFYLGRKKV
jgi:hypothetical protein